LSSFAQTLAAGRAIQPITIFGIGLALVTCCLAGGLLLTDASFGPAWAVLILGALSILAERRPVRVNSNVELTASLLPVVFTAVMFGPLAAMAVGALGLVITFQPPYMRWLIWTCTRALGAGLSGVAASLILVDDLSAGRLFGAVAVAAFVNSAFDTMMGALVIKIRRSGDSLSGLRLIRPILLGTVPLYTAILVLLIYAYEEFSGWSLFLFLVPAFAAHRLHGLYREQRQTTDQLRVANERLENANLSFATALVAALDARDQYTAGHSAAVAVYARDIASRLGLSEECQQTAHLCGLVHDIGKVGLPAGLLEKPGALTLEERRRMEEHSAIGERILGKVDDYAEIAWIVPVADAYNAMTSGRPYRDAMPSRVARFRLAQAAGTQFDTTVVAAFEAILAGASETYLSGVRSDFTVEAQRQLPLAVASVA
jgi:HD-GYP domain-containing protein (c-di-GMP phosphodiesterase class II)